MTTTRTPASLTTTEAGRSLPLRALAVGRYIWHDGAFRRVTKVEGRVVHMAGRHVLRSYNANTVEVAPTVAVWRETRGAA